MENHICLSCCNQKLQWNIPNSLWLNVFCFFLSPSMQVTMSNRVSMSRSFSNQFYITDSFTLTVRLHIRNLEERSWLTEEFPISSCNHVSIGTKNKIKRSLYITVHSQGPEVWPAGLALCVHCDTVCDTWLNKLDLTQLDPYIKAASINTNMRLVNLSGWIKYTWKSTYLKSMAYLFL